MLPAAPAAAADVSELVGDLLRTIRTYGNDRLEFEFRLGHKTGVVGQKGGGGGFRPGVDGDAWARLKAALDASKDWTVTNSVTTERIDSSGSKLVLDASNAPVCVIHKKRLVDRDFATDSPWCARASLSLEEREDPPPAGLKHVYERRKKRWSYAYKCWSVDLTQVAGNMPHQLDDDQESYEVEIELRDTQELFVRTVDSIVGWGWGMIHDVCKLLQPPK
jgi:hypothetical protein